VFEIKKLDNFKSEKLKYFFINFLISNFWDHLILDLLKINKKYQKAETNTN
jgi:hypothetical protein